MVAGYIIDGFFLVRHTTLHIIIPSSPRSPPLLPSPICFSRSGRYFVVAKAFLLYIITFILIVCMSFFFLVPRKLK